MNKYRFFLLVCTLLCFSLFGDDDRIIEFNQRASESIDDDPSIAIYYAEMSLDINKYSNREEYVNSNFIKSQAYYNLNDLRAAGIESTLAYKFIKEENYFYKNSSFYVFYGMYLFEVRQYTELGELLTNEEILELLDDWSLLYFNLLKIKRDLFFDKDNIEELLNSSIEVGLNLSANDILGEFYIIYGDIYFNINLERSRDYYQSALELGDDKISAKALLKLGQVYREWQTPFRSINYLEKAYLITEELKEYKLTVDILNNLSESYRDVGDYKNLSITEERINYHNKKEYEFLLKEQIELVSDDFQLEKLSLELDLSKKSLTNFKLISLILGSIILFLIIILSIQQYKIRAYHIGEH